MPLLATQLYSEAAYEKMVTTLGTILIRNQERELFADFFFS